MWTLGSMKLNGRQKENKRKLRSISKKPRRIKIEKIKVDEIVELADGTKMRIDTRTILTMPKEEAIRIGFIKRNEKKKNIG